MRRHGDGLSTSHFTRLNEYNGENVVAEMVAQEGPSYMDDLDSLFSHYGRFKKDLKSNALGESCLTPNPNPNPNPNTSTNTNTNTNPNPNPNPNTISNALGDF